MSHHTTIDTSKLLAELTGTDWGAAPSDARELVRERHELHRTALRDLSDDAVARLLDMGVGSEFLVPVAMERLRSEPDRMFLLCAVLRDISVEAAWKRTSPVPAGAALSPRMSPLRGWHTHDEP